mmetsp:Transcript_28175/g.72113  ORF Transcript_28175/g.72113 Transcript_28175/m.72113 type:complete len:272 (+) Transcript_28175:2194-3009(+)
MSASLMCQPEATSFLYCAASSGATTSRECFHLYSSWSSTRASECWHVNAVPSISRRMRVVLSMMEGLLQNLPRVARRGACTPGDQKARMVEEDEPNGWGQETQGRETQRQQQARRSGGGRHRSCARWQDRGGGARGRHTDHQQPYTCRLLNLRASTQSSCWLVVERTVTRNLTDGYLAHSARSHPRLAVSTPSPPVCSAGLAPRTAPILSAMGKLASVATRSRTPSKRSLAVGTLAVASVPIEVPSASAADRLRAGRVGTYSNPAGVDAIR